MKQISMRENGTVRVCTVNEEPSKTDQQFKDDTDVNKVLEKYMKTGEWPGKPRGQYVDTTQIGDFHEAMTTVVQAQDAFMTLDAKVRARFSNDPGEMLRFLNDEQNYEEAAKLGLLDPEKVKARRAGKNDDLTTINAEGADKEGSKQGGPQ